SQAGAAAGHSREQLGALGVIGGRLGEHRSGGLSGLFGAAVVPPDRHTKYCSTKPPGPQGLTLVFRWNCAGSVTPRCQWPIIFWAMAARSPRARQSGQVMLSGRAAALAFPVPC